MNDHIPDLTDDERRAALMKAAENRRKRADCLRQLSQQEISLEAVLNSQDRAIRRLKVKTVLKALRGIGKIKAQKLLAEFCIAEQRRISGLGKQQRERLMEWYRETYLRKD